ncbi:hypothetical protein GCM10010211_68490 [Streptomyces albospinus]|uniref:Uncharacterized protein n=1 Tax=Streptomyces albospinus TaxID=285515 RepID=A0ABQ2VK23_9ACTN|nr:hypothetical protein GCM10010211_68490 [Streptomyces albospinus]
MTEAPPNGDRTTASPTGHSDPLAVPGARYTEPGLRRGGLAAGVVSGGRRPRGLPAVPPRRKADSASHILLGNNL